MKVTKTNKLQYIKFLKRWGYNDDEIITLTLKYFSGTSKAEYHQQYYNKNYEKIKAYQKEYQKMYREAHKAVKQ